MSITLTASEAAHADELVGMLLVDLAKDIDQHLEKGEYAEALNLLKQGACFTESEAWKKKHESVKLLVEKK